MGKRLTALAVALALVVGLCPGTALAAADLTAGPADLTVGSAAGRDAALTTQATKAANATKLAKKAIKLMNALPKQSKVKLAHVKKTAAAYDAVHAATKDWAAFSKTGAGTRKAFLGAFNKKFAPACYALEKQVKDASAKAKKAQVKNVKVAPGKGSATVSWKALGLNYGYEVYYSAKKSSGYKKAESTRAAKLTVKNLDGGKTYYFKVRAYRADIPATALVGDLGKVVYGKSSSPVAAKPAASLTTAATKPGLATSAAAGVTLRTQAAASALSDPNVQDAFDSCRVYLRDIKGKKGYATGTLKGDLEKMRGVIGNLDAYADKVKADRAKKSFDTFNNIKAPSDWTTEEVWQTGTALNQVTVKWGVPAVAKRDDVTMLHWRISWRKLGDVKWSAPATVAYSSSPYAAREHVITGLAQGTSYEVRVGYRYQVGGDGGSYVTVDDWRSCTAVTAMSLTFSEASFDYHFTTHNESRAALEVSVAGPEMHDLSGDFWFWYEWYVTPGATFDKASANKLYGDDPYNYGLHKDNELPTIYGTRIGCYQTMSDIDFGLRNGNAVATVGVRTVSYFSSRDSHYNLIVDVSRSGWSTKHVVADPRFSIGKDVRDADYMITGFVVEIPPLKNAKSYTVYLGKRKSSDSSEVTGWKAAGTYAANGGKTTKAVVNNYGGKKFPKYFSSKEWAVKVVTNTMYGSSPGEYWVSYNHNGLILHEGMIY